MKKVSVVFITDGRINLLKQTLKSFHDNISFPFEEKMIINDSVNPNVIKSVGELSSEYRLSCIHHEDKKGFAGVYNTAFRVISEQSDFAMFIEDDFLFNEPVAICKLIDILEGNRNLVQVTLKRQAWGDEERRFGGFMEQWPDLYEEKTSDGMSWCEHRAFFSTNPCLVPAWVLKYGWPLVPHSEKVFGDTLFRNPNYKSAVYGKKYDKPLVEHLGLVRNGVNY